MPWLRERTNYLTDMAQPYNKKVWKMEMQEKQKLKKKDSVQSWANSNMYWMTEVKSVIKIYVNLTYGTFPLRWHKSSDFFLQWWNHITCFCNEYYSNRNSVWGTHNLELTHDQSLFSTERGSRARRGWVEFLQYWELKERFRGHPVLDPQLSVMINVWLSRIPSSSKEISILPLSLYQQPIIADSHNVQ